MTRFSLLSAFVWILTIATLLSSLAKFHWILDTVANLRLQGLVTISCLALISLALRCWRITFVSFLLLLVNLSMINFGSFDASAELTNPIRVITSNVWTRNANYDAVVEELRSADADVIAIIELTPGLATRLRQEFGRSYPYSSLEDSDGDDFGIGIMSRLPIESIHTLRRPGCTLSMEAKIRDYRIIATHPVPPIGSQGFESRNRQFDYLARHIRPALKRPQHTVLLGDFNLTPWNPIFTELLADAGLRRAAPRWGFTPTWYGVRGTLLGTPLAFLFGLKIDHVLISDDLLCSTFAIGEDCGSDHRSVLVTLGGRRTD